MMKELMRKIKMPGFLLAGMLFIIISLCGCGKELPPEKTFDGMTWDSSWVTIGNYIGVEVPEGFTDERTEGIVYDSRTFYNVWTKGEPIKYTNKEETEVTTYDVQIHLLAEDAQTADQALQSSIEWQTISDERYTYREKIPAECAGDAYTIYVYDHPDDGGPASHDASATIVRGHWAIHVDVISTTEEKPEEVLSDFLAHIHFAE